MNNISWCLLVIGVLTIAGCLEEKSEFTINPDGAGKVIHEVTVQPMTFGIGGQNVDAKAQLKQTVEQILSQSSGVDTWKDISYKLTDDGRMYFKAAAFFPDINKLSIYNAGLKLHFSKDQNGEITIELKAEEQDTGEDMEPVPPQLSEAELDKRVKETKLQYNQMRIMMQGFLSAFRAEAVLHLPGEIKEISNFEKVDNNSVRITLEGSKLLEIMDEMMADEQWLKEQIRAGKSPGTPGAEEDLLMNEKLFGEKSPVRVVVARANEQLFDYKMEMTAAKENYDDMLEKLGLDVAEEKPVEQDVQIGDVGISDTAVQGRISSTEVALGNASFENGNLAVYTGDDWGFNPSVLIFLFIEKGNIPENKLFTVETEVAFAPGTPHIHYRWKDIESGQLKTDMIMQGYRLHLKFGQVVNGKIPGEILFEIPGKDTRIEGHFNADIKGIALKKKGVDRSVSEKETVAPAVPDYSRPVIKQLRDAYGKKRAGDLDEAIEICRKIIVNTKATSRQLAKAYDQMARCYLAKGDKDKAAEYFQQLISEFPEEKVYARKARKELKKLGVGVTGRKPRHKESPENYPDFFGFE